MTASASKRGRRALVGLLAWASAGCSTTPTPDPRTALEPLPALASRVPERVDYLAGDAAAAGLASDAAALERTLAELRELERTRAEAGGRPSGLEPRLLELQSAMADDALGYRSTTDELLARDDLAPELRSRLERQSADDPLELAEERLGEARRLDVARYFNALAEPVGRSLVSGALLPVRLARAVVGIAVTEHLEDELSRPERQALAHWKEFVEAHPESPEAASLLAEMEESQRLWYRTQRDRLLRRARRALDAGHDRSALLLSDRALLYAPEDVEAMSLRDEARVRVEHRKQGERRSLAAAPEADVGAARELLEALLVRPDAIALHAEQLREADPGGPLADEASFASALAHAEAGVEDRSWDAFEELADDEQSNMARHAWAELWNPWQNPHRYYRAARAKETGARLRWLALGPLSGGPRDRDLPDPLEWAIELPTVLEIPFGLPGRLLRYPWTQPEKSPAAVHARRYLVRRPDGEHAAELREWLEAYEADRDNWVAAAAWARGRPDADPGHLADLEERAAGQALEIARAAPRRDVRLSLLRELLREYPDTAAAREAGGDLRDLARTATPQHIRISRGFLLENPSVAGPQGLALRPELLDDDPDNGELHPDGVALLAGHLLELAFVNPSGNEREAPVRRRRRVSKERMLRVVTLLEEVHLRTALVDPDYELEPDADRDLFFERVRLGVADEPDPRASAESSYAFISMRERYGLVRSHEPVLPVDLVLQISGGDFGLGAFPRLRPPRPTRDAILFE